MDFSLNTYREMLQPVNGNGIAVLYNEIKDPPNN